ncbi:MULTISPECIES: PilZ domain-containing protein [Gammaproteobacteria]|uniref:PilZ domain-containing protein n=1 Tax=Gammaproteobacteria TaxID=1236 RepID=UPI000DD07019|nr:MULTISPECIES: PilZ domain-containing protein [Gammaproteobacteria]RTE87155.1 PilZ domain-containing protein [Aliidiomarina sp. B3213]TCZ93057.1 PilZ domain-containing protein [Lysobacter sp. N42]
MITQDDNRDFRRMQVEVPIEITLLHEDGEPVVQGICRDLSATGLAFATKTEIEKGAEVIVIISAGGQLPPLTAKISVVRSDYDNETEFFELGGQIIEIL